MLKKLGKSEKYKNKYLLKSFFGAVDHECWVAIDSMCATSWAHAPELDSNSTSTRDRPEIVTTASFTGPAPRDSEFLTFLQFVFVKSVYAASARLKSFHAASARLKSLFVLLKTDELLQKNARCEY